MQIHSIKCIVGQSHFSLAAADCKASFCVCVPFECKLYYLEQVNINQFTNYYHIIATAAFTFTYTALLRALAGIYIGSYYSYDYYGYICNSLLALFLGEINIYNNKPQHAAAITND